MQLGFFLYGQRPLRSFALSLLLNQIPFIVLSLVIIQLESFFIKILAKLSQTQAIAQPSLQNSNQNKTPKSFGISSTLNFFVLFEKTHANSKNSKYTLFDHLNKVRKQTLITLFRGFCDDRTNQKRNSRSWTNSSRNVNQADDQMRQIKLSLR